MNTSKSSLVTLTHGGLQSDDIINVIALAREIEAANNALTKYFREQFAKAGLVPIPAWASAKPDVFKEDVLKTVNTTLADDNFYSDARFCDVTLSPYTQKLLGQKPSGTKLHGLHRLLLLDAFHNHFRRKRGRGKNQIQKPATVHRLSNGKWAVLLTLVEPREIEGKIRSGNFKRERQTEKEANDLCAEINAKLCGKELARQLTPKEIASAKKFFWELLEPEHPEWVDYLDQLVEHCEKTGFVVDNGVKPLIVDAVKLFWTEHLEDCEADTRMNYRNAFAFLLPVFANYRTNELTDQMILRMAHGSEPLQIWASSWKKGQTPEEAAKRRWDTPKTSKSRRPWSLETKNRFIGCCRKFKIWMHKSIDPITLQKRNWCPATELQVPKTKKQPRGKALDHESEEAIQLLVKKNPALTIPQCQAIIDISDIAFDGNYAAFYAHCMFGGSRVKETKRMGVGGFDPEDGVQAIADEAAKTDEGRESKLHDNLIVIIEGLKAAGLYANKNLRPNHNQRAAIHILAGFTSNSKQAHLRAKRERKRLAKLGIILPEFNWGVPFPKNGLRRTALSMHYKLYASVSLTVDWAGNSRDVFKEYYKRLVTKADARKYWVMLPSRLKAAGIAVSLPVGHQLDSAMTTELKTSSQAAGESMKLAVGKIKQAKAEAAARRPAELKAQRAVYNKRAYEKRKAKKLGIQLKQPQPAGGHPPPSGA